MERFQKIISNEKYQKTYKKLQELEKDRKFCGHDMEHFLAVARICYLMVLERNMSVSKDVIYGAAFLHDMGRADQYEKGISHEEAGACFAAEILPQCGYTLEEQQLIVDTILSHRKHTSGKEETFAQLFYCADKLSRDCIHCEVRDLCYWPEERKNHYYRY